MALYCLLGLCIVFWGFPPSPPLPRAPRWRRQRRRWPLGRRPPAPPGPSAGGPCSPQAPWRAAPHGYLFVWPESCHTRGVSWYSDTRINASTSSELLPMLEVWAESMGTKRGQLQLQGKAVRVRAFVAKDRFFFCICSREEGEMIYIDVYNTQIHVLYVHTWECSLCGPALRHVGPHQLPFSSNGFFPLWMCGLNQGLPRGVVMSLPGFASAALHLCRLFRQLGVHLLHASGATSLLFLVWWVFSLCHGQAPPLPAPPDSHLHFICQCL